MRINLTKKDLVNSVYMQIGFSKQISENLIDDFLNTIVENLKHEKKLKLAKFGTFLITEALAAAKVPNTLFWTPEQIFSSTKGTCL